MNNMMITEFNYKNNIVNTITDEKCETWFRGKDVATILGYKDTGKTIRTQVDNEDRLKRSDINGGDFNPPLSHNEKNTIYINESGLHSLILGSKLKTAKRLIARKQEKRRQ